MADEYKLVGNWADKYSTETLEHAYGLTFAQAHDPAYMFDAERQAQIARNRDAILAELVKRGVI